MLMRQPLQNCYNFFESRYGHWVLGIIVTLNALALGFQTSTKVSPEIEEILVYFDYFVLSFYVFELLTKLVTEGLDFFKKGWNVFDLIVVMGSLWQDNNFIPILRAFRVFHLMGAMEISPKMRHILSGIEKSLPGIAHIFSILLLFFYIASVMGVFLFRDTGVENFQHLGSAMRTMFQVMTGDDWTEVMHSVEAKAPYAWIYFTAFYIILVMVILNLFIGVVVNSLQNAEEEINPSEAPDTTSLADLKAQLIRLEAKIDQATIKEPIL